MLKVSFEANVLDLGMRENARYFRARLKDLEYELAGEYGGPIDELWIHGELIPTRIDDRPAHPLRFQRRVSGRAPFSGPPAIPDAHNGGHSSVRPDFTRIRETPPSRPFSYLLGRILASFDALRGKRSIRGFDVDAFVATFRAATSKLEFRIGRPGVCCGWGAPRQHIGLLRQTCMDGLSDHGDLSHSPGLSIGGGAVRRDP